MTVIDTTPAACERPPRPAHRDQDNRPNINPGERHNPASGLEEAISRAASTADYDAWLEHTDSAGGCVPLITAKPTKLGGMIAGSLHGRRRTTAAIAALNRAPRASARRDSISIPPLSIACGNIAGGWSRSTADVGDHIQPPCASTTEIPPCSLRVR